MKPVKLKYYQLILGCQMNKSDAERVASFLESLGFVKTVNEKEANLIVAQACSVRQSAVDRIKGRIDRWRAEQERRPASNFLITALTGCVLPADRKIFEKQFDLVCETEEIMVKLGKRLQNFTRPMVGALNKVGCVLGRAAIPPIGRAGMDGVEDTDFFSLAPKYSSKFQAYIPIQTGCNNFCAYCAVPYTKGPERCRPYKKIVQEVTNLAKNGYKEIILLGQNVNSYCDQIKMQNAKCKMIMQNSKMDFASLLQIINKIDGDFWIRFISSNPWDLSDEIIKAVAECQKVCEYVHLPLQSGSDKILKKMNRRYSQKEYLELIDKIRAQIPNVSITTDIIVGFPGETKADFLETVKVMKKVKFDMAYIARYSPRPGTVSACFMKDNVSAEEKKRREKYLECVLSESSLEQNQQYVGKIVDVLVEKLKSQNSMSCRHGMAKLHVMPTWHGKTTTPCHADMAWQNSKLFLLGKTRTFKTVKFVSDKDLTGRFVRVKIIKAKEFGLEGVINNNRPKYAVQN